MDTNIYWLQSYADSKLADARANSARAALIASIRGPRSGALASLGSALIRIGRTLRRRGRARRAPRVAVPSLS